jgi:hypothetical protein
MTQLPDEAREAVRAIVHDIVLGRFAELERDGRAGRLTADEIRLAVLQFSRTLIDLPDEAWPVVDSYTCAVSDVQFAVDVPMWTNEDGQSDLSLSLTVELHGGTARVSIDNFHVL